MLNPENRTKALKTNATKPCTSILLVSFKLIILSAHTADIKNTSHETFKRFIAVLHINASSLA